MLSKTAAVNCTLDNPNVFEILENSALLINTLNRSNFNRVEACGDDLHSSMARVASVRNRLASSTSCAPTLIATLYAG